MHKQKDLIELWTTHVTIDFFVEDSDVYRLLTFFTYLHLFVGVQPRTDPSKMLRLTTMGCGDAVTTLEYWTIISCVQLCVKHDFELRMWVESLTTLDSRRVVNVMFVHESFLSGGLRRVRLRRWRVGRVHVFLFALELCLRRGSGGSIFLMNFEFWWNLGSWGREGVREAKQIGSDTLFGLNSRSTGNMLF